jgi:hypothetical protein
MRVNPSFPAPHPGRAGWLGFAFITAMAVASCSKSTQSGNADADGGNDSGVLDTSLGDDAFIGDDVFIGDDSSPANCEIPDGLYTVTLTPASDAGGGGDAGAGCTTTTMSLTWPWGAGGDGGTLCTLTPDGMTPSCTIEFDCTQRGTTTTTKSQGYIEVYQTSYSGYETVTVNDNAIGMQQLSQCTYNMALVHQ